MNAIKYIGMDVHLATISIAVLDVNGKLTMEVTIATQSSALLDFIRGLSGTLNVTFEEGTAAQWLYTLLEPHVAKVVVCDPRQNPRRLGEKKSDRLDARKLAEGLRLGTLKPVYHGNALGPALKEVSRSYRTLVSDTTRVMSRLKALYRRAGSAVREAASTPRASGISGCSNCASPACEGAPNGSTNSWTCCCLCARRRAPLCSARVASTPRRRFYGAFRLSVRYE